MQYEKIKIGSFVELNTIPSIELSNNAKEYISKNKINAEVIRKDPETLVYNILVKFNDGTKGWLNNNDIRIIINYGKSCSDNSNNIFPVSNNISTHKMKI